MTDTPNNKYADLLQRQIDSMEEIVIKLANPHELKSFELESALLCEVSATVVLMARAAIAVEKYLESDPSVQTVHVTVNNSENNS